MGNSVSPEYEQYMRDVRDYLAKVQRGRRVPRVDPNHPSLSQESDDMRIIGKGNAPAGYGLTPPEPADLPPEVKALVDYFFSYLMHPPTPPTNDKK